MRALVVQDYAAWREHRIGVIPDPVPAETEVLLQILAAEVNFPDILHMEGRYQVKVDLPFVPGLGGVGRILKVGAAVSDISPGQRVLALPTHGMHAEKAVVAAENCFPIPEDVPDDVAAALGLAYQTAWFALTRRAFLTSDDRVLVLGATGGIGMATIQLAKALGARQVIAATRGAEAAALALELGADAVIDTSVSAEGEEEAGLRERLCSEVSELTQGHGADIIIDPIGGGTAAAAMRAMAWSGRYVVIGFAAGDIPTFKANYLLVKNISVTGLQWTDYRSRECAACRDAQAQIYRLWCQGMLRPRISQKLPLSRFQDAFAALEQGAARGKIVLIPDDLTDEVAI